MRVLGLLVIGTVVAWGGDARRGGDLFKTEGCIQCHRVGGEGGTAGPDLGRRTSRGYTPAVMAAVMWNHAPAMWQAIGGRGITRPSLTPEQADDMFAFFYWARYFDDPGDAARGKQLFSSKHCSHCHGITASRRAGAPAVVKWGSLTDPIALAQQMWNHSREMRAAFRRENIAWPALTAQELTDILVYLQNLPETRGQKADFQMPEGKGAGLFQSKGCSGCHRGNLDLERRLHDRTLTDIAAAMWNHSAKMTDKAGKLEAGEMRELLGFLWARQFYAERGNPWRGERVFTSKQCAGCHIGGGAPKLDRGPGSYSAPKMVSVLWKHGPSMLEAMEKKGVAWPRFTTREMSDLIAYLNSNSNRAD